MKIPYGKHFIDKDDIKNVSKVLKARSITQGPLINKFEKEICKLLKVKYAVAVSSCTAGLHIAVQAIKKKKSHVLTSPVSFVSTANSALFNDLKPIFVDINSQNLNIDFEKVKLAIKRNKKIRAIIPVHLGGVASGSKEIFKTAKKKNIFIIEDAAHSFGGKYEDGSLIGSCKYADMSVFSFHPVKTITTGEGGVITTNSKDLFLKLQVLRNHGIQKDKKYFKNKKLAYTNKKINPWYYEMIDLGFNYRITDIQCALGISQLKKLKKILSKRKEVAKYYDKKLRNIDGLSLVQNKDRARSSNHLYIIGIDFKKIKINKNVFMKKLFEKGITTQLHYIPIPMHPYYSSMGYNMKNLSNSFKYYEKALSIPIFYQLSKKNLKKIVNNLKKLVK
jgi:UDP-4-amino-4,6-dideoxy-N-acetyl-beta-L-altrosamine transaminase